MQAEQGSSGVKWRPIANEYNGDSPSSRAGLALHVLQPRHVHGVSDVVAISAGCTAAHTLAATRDGTVYGWGVLGKTLRGWSRGYCAEATPTPYSSVRAAPWVG